MNARVGLLLIALLVVCSAQLGVAHSTELNIKESNLRNLEMDEQKFLQNIGGDGHLSFRGLELRRDQACAISMDLTFSEPMSRAAVFEVFWHTAGSGFSERHKAAFLINQKDTHQSQRFIVPLCKLFHYSGNINQPAGQKSIAGIRIDYPSNRTIAIRFDSLQLLDAVQTNTLLLQRPAGVKFLEPYERLSPAAFTSMDVVLPKLFFAFEEGLNRLWQDKAFLIFWLLLICLLFALILRSVLRQDAL